MMPPPPRPPPLPPPLPPAAPPPEPPPNPKDLIPVPPDKVLRRLFLTLFLRGYSARGLQRGRQRAGAPKSVGQKLAWTLVMYFLMGFVGAMFLMVGHQTLFTLSLWMHGMTFMILGMYVAASAGEVLFNQQEADILLHRPVEPRALLWAKIGVLVQVSLWLAGAFNLVGLFVALGAPDGGWLYPVVHAVSTVLEALLCTGTVVLAYQLCLRWFGRERLNNLMTMVQVVVAVAAVLAGQIVPRVIGRFVGPGSPGHLTSDVWWLAFLPPAWFAGFDNLLTGHGELSSLKLAALGLLATGLVLWAAFGRLAGDYVSGLQSLGETTNRNPARRRRRRWLGRLVEIPPLSWWLRDSITRASFLLTAAYLARDRDVKLRVYPSIAPLLIMPLIMLTQKHHGGDGGDEIFVVFMSAFVGMYGTLAPLFLLDLLRISQNWQAADLFRAAPMAGPTPLFDGLRRAVLLLMTLPLTAGFAALVWLVNGRNFASLEFLLPGLILLPAYSLLPGLGGRAVPLSQPIETAKAAGRSLGRILIGIIPLVMAAVVVLAWKFGWFTWLLVAETAVVMVCYPLLRLKLNAVRWPSME